MPSSVACFLQALAVAQSTPVQRRDERFPGEDAGFRCFAAARVTPRAGFASRSRRLL